MNVKQITEIIKIANKKLIIAELMRLGYTNCKKHKEYRKISLETLFDGVLLETDEFPDDKGNRRYQGGIIKNVKGYERLEFAIVNICDIKNIFPIDMLIWAKEV